MLEQHVPQVVQDLVPLLDRYGYWAIFGSIFFEDFGVPLPGETMLIAGSFLAALGQFRIGWVMLLAFGGAVAGDNIGYAIGRFGGRKLVLRFGRYVFLNEARLDKAEAFFGCHGGKVVTVARFVEGFRQLNGLVAGVSRMAWWRFLAFNALGAALWVGTWGSVAYFFGGRLGTVLAVFKRFELYFVVGTVLLITVAVAYKLAKRRRQKRGV